jgi:uncharacterized protein YbaR (Trm112 family)
MIGFDKKHLHEFDGGNKELLVECKNYHFTKTNKKPSAKLSTLKQEILHFLACPNNYKKILVINKTSNGKETLGEYFVRTSDHLIPKDLVVFNFDVTTNQLDLIHGVA